MSDLPWHVIHGETLMTMLRQVQEGGDPDLVYMEHFANAEPGGDE